MPGHPRRSTLRRWHTEGLPQVVHALSYVMEKLGITPPPPTDDQGFFVDFRMNPMFEEKVLSHENGHYIVQDWMGAITEISDEFDVTFIRNAVDFVTRKWHKFPVETRRDWEVMRPRFDAHDPARLPENLAAIAPLLKERDFALSININGPFWQLREWMGMENLCIAFLTEPEFVGEMIDFWSDFVITILKRFLPFIQPDRVQINEDMAYKAHSMISPALTREFLQPVYEKWSALLKSFNVPIIDMDSDGYVADLIPIWIDSGINVCDPIEVAAYNDIVKFRQTFGNKMAFYGGIDKRAIAAGGQIMRDEVMRVVPPLFKDGGFIPGCDHGVPPDISFDNYVEYTRLLAQLSGWL